MGKPESKAIQPIVNERIVRRIVQVREERVMLDVHLAEMYEVETRVLKQAVRRNRERFPEDFMYELSKEEASLLGLSQKAKPRIPWSRLNEGRRLCSLDPSPSGGDQAGQIRPVEGTFQGFFGLFLKFPGQLFKVDRSGQQPRLECDLFDAS
jgi:hypothetical protein